MEDARGSAPLVSIIVRSMGRTSLPRALASIAAQTHRPVEIVLVDARPSGLAMESFDAIPVRVVGGTSLPRAQAANAGLVAARGKWMLLLDEDDTIAPDHVASLIATAEKAHLPVAYSQTMMVDAAGKPRRIFGGPFRRDLLRVSNYLAINAVLFAWTLVDGGARFDASLPVFEDWDFWMQLANRADFAFSGKATALYNAEEGTSGAGAGANLNRETLLSLRAKLMAKWSGS
jgi:glycosyltransferase involved in cell wall biosynthesis